jgi:hypothetical protein
MRSPKKLFQRKCIIPLNKGKGDLPIHLRQVLFILASGKVDLEMVKENKDGQMVLCTLESGEKTEHMEEVSLYM